MITRDDVLKCARLSKLSLEEEEIETYTQQLSQILEYVEKLNELDTGSIEPTFHVLPNLKAFREDEPQTNSVLKKVFELAPDSENQFFKVPKVI